MRDAALDASCDLRYYASDHFASQAGLTLTLTLALTLPLAPTLTLPLALTLR